MTEAARKELERLLRRFAESRQKLSVDRYRPLYHFVSPECGLNDPNGICFWRGRWHLFYQGYREDGPCPVWGHAISDDLIHWRDLQYALVPPGPGHGCWSGSTLVEEDRVIAIYYAHPLGNSVAVADDPQLSNWRRISDQVVIPCAVPIWTAATGHEGGETSRVLHRAPPPAGAINFVYDPCIWRRDGVYYSLSGGTVPHGPSGRRMRAEYLYRSTDLVSWEYMHPFIEGDIYGIAGDDGGCPYFWPIGDRHILLHFSHRTGAHYLLGDYDTDRDKFVVTYGGRFTFGAYSPGGVHAPSATPDGQGGVIAIFNVNKGKPTPGWDQIMSLPRRLTLIGRDDLGVEPAGDIGSLRGAHQHLKAMALPANREIVMDGVQGDAIEIGAEIETGLAQTIELNVLRSPGKQEFTRIAFYRQRGCINWDRSDGWDGASESRDSILAIDTSYSSELPDVESRPPELAPVYLAPGSPLKLRVFVDRSVVEVFANGRQCATVRVYPGRADSLGVSMRAQGADAELRALDVWQMHSIYERQSRE